MKNFRWRIPVVAILVAAAVLLPLDVQGTTFSFLLNLFAVAPLLFLATVMLVIYLIVQGARSRLKGAVALSLLTALISVSSLALLLAVSSHTIRDYGRWLFWSTEYKAEVLRQPTPPSGHLKHIQWDSWGLFAQDFDEFLVFDPTDSLATPQGSDPGIIIESTETSGSPFAARRLQRNWYLVTYPF